MNFVALKMLVGDRAKYLGIIFGVTFASLLITQQGAIVVGLMAKSPSRGEFVRRLVDTLL